MEDALHIEPVEVKGHVRLLHSRKCHYSKKHKEFMFLDKYLISKNKSNNCMSVFLLSVHLSLICSISSILHGKLS
jgi:hypothetical protein